MRLLPRDTGFASLASSLSLAVANYKPIPQLPVESNSTAVKGGNQLMPIGAGGQSAQQSFQVQTPGAASTYDQSHPIAEWGEPSVLYVPNNTDSNNANQLKATSTIGPGKCAVQQKYTPTSALPAPTYPAFDPVQANVYRYRQQQGVNLGAWVFI